MVLTENDLIHLNRTGEQLKSAIRNLITQMPKSAQSIAGMAKWLNGNKSTCQRLLNVMHKSNDGLDVILLVPGVEGINQFIDCAQVRQINGLLIQEAKKASQTFYSDVKSFARSHAQLKRQLQELKNQPQTAHSPSIAENNRRLHYQASEQLLGESSELSFATFIATPNLENADYYHEFAIVSRQQVRVKTQARPFMQYYSKNQLPFSTEPNVNVDSSAQVKTFDLGIVEAFSSIDLKEAYSGYSQTSSSLVFSNLKSEQQPFDATFLFNDPQDALDPLTSDNKTTCHSISIKVPTQRLVMLVFLDKRYDIRSTVSVGCYPYNLQVERESHNCDEIWNERLPEFPDLKIVNAVTPISQLTGLPRSDEMVQYLFDYAQLDKADFVCYMIDVSYPIWSSAYRIYFKFC